MFSDYAQWLYRFGHELDPKAAIKLEAFTPPLIGYKTMANFKTLSLPGAGSILLGIAWALGPLVAWFDWRKRKKAAAAAESA
jgi:copper chaperone NosL